MATDVQAPQLLTVREVADRLKLSEKSVRRRIASGELPAVRLGGRGTQLRVDERELVGQRSKLVTADRYTHALVDYGEVDRAKLLERVRPMHTAMHTTPAKSAA
jgi:excisionase family DNA binding protein